MLRPGLILVPTAGRPLALNGRDGRLTDVTVCVVVPKFVITTTCVSVIPTGTSAGPVSSGSSMETALACGISPSWVPSALSGTSTLAKARDLVANASVPSAVPAADGRNVTHAVSLSPLDSVTGNLTRTGVWLPRLVLVTRPTRNSFVGTAVFAAPVLTVTPVNLTEARAVTETRLVMLVLILVGANVAAFPTAAALGAGRLNPSTWSSAVPTYIHPLLVAGVQNLTAAPTFADQIGASWHGAADVHRDGVLPLETSEPSAYA
jgi:hypothetical protein